ncbi:MAG: ankyrin repeat domain-containing protein [Sterolibacterium sp.]|nr:ankyrin repeat domain-containing protein [Sterolibacterium sp.]
MEPFSHTKALKSCFSRLASPGMAIVIATGLLTGCGEHGFMESPKASLKTAEAKTNPAAQCFFVGKGLGENDMKLFAATGDGDIPRVEQLIEAGANINATDSLKRTPLFAAVFCNHPQAINLLIGRGSDINAMDFSGMSPLHAAVVVGAVHAVQTLIEKGANLDMRNMAGHTPLHLAAATNQIAMVELLLEHGANAQVNDKNGNAAAFLASDNGHTIVVATLKKWQEKQKTQTQKQSL